MKIRYYLVKKSYTKFIFMLENITKIFEIFKGQIIMEIKREWKKWGI